MPTARQFWIVWNPCAHAPPVRYFSRAEADAEAARRASLHPGQEFFVLRAVAGFFAAAPYPTEIVLRRATVNEVIEDAAQS